MKFHTKFKFVLTVSLVWCSSVTALRQTEAPANELLEGVDPLMVNAIVMAQDSGMSSDELKARCAAAIELGAEHRTKVLSLLSELNCKEFVEQRLMPILEDSKK